MTMSDFLRWILTGKIRKDTEKYLHLANRGNPRAQLKMGLCYYNGKDVSQNSQEAARWFLLAAKQGNAEAEFYMGRAFHTGDGVLKNPEFAYAWFLRAAENGHKNAKEWVLVLQRDMTPEEITEGLTLSKEAIGRI